MAWAILAQPVAAKEGDTFRPFVSYSRYYDNNLFRLDGGNDSTAILEDGKRVDVTRDNGSDQYGVLGAGLNVDWRPGRQRVEAKASKSLVRFSRYSSLDYDGSDYQLKWNWRVGNYWSGQVGASETVTQTSFADWYAFEVINNQVTRTNRFANAEWQLHPRWNIGLGASTYESTNSDDDQARQDYEDTSYSATLGYATPKGSKLRAQLRKVDGEYPKRPSIPNTYTQTEYNLLADWATTGKLVARGKLGYVQRENGKVSQRDFSGLTGRLSADYFPTAKTALSWALYRDLSNSDDANATYQVNTGTSLGGLWQVTAKLALRANASYENRSFEGDTGLPALPGTPRRDEDTLGGSLSLSYMPARMSTIDLGLQAGRRDSNITGSNYTFRSLFLNVRADF